MSYSEIFTIINALSTTDHNKVILLNVFIRLREEGYSASEERIRIIVTSLRFLGFEYFRHQELTNEKSLDCSTLISQSFWEGAMIGIPFIAENQRTASTGSYVTQEELRPADIVYKFKDLESSFDKLHNHVALVLGRWNNDIYLIESNSKDGCIISTYEVFMTDGGGKSFINNPKVEVSEDQISVLRKISQFVPKLARFGARQHTIIENLKIEHEGIDIYVPAETPVYAPIAGTVRYTSLDQDYLPAIEVTSPDGKIQVVLGNIQCHLGLDFVEAGQQLGVSFDSSGSSKILYSKFDGLGHIHFEVRVKAPLHYWNNSIARADYFCVNGLYAVKRGTLDLPIKGIDVPSLFFIDECQSPSLLK